MSIKKLIIKAIFNTWLEEFIILPSCWIKHVLNVYEQLPLHGEPLQVFIKLYAAYMPK